MGNTTFRTTAPLLGLAVLGLFRAPGRPTPHVEKLGRAVIVVELDPRMRSAFLLRATGEDKVDQGLSPEAAREQLKAHFDAVIGILDSTREASIELALSRLEARRGETWSKAERQTWRERLEAEREANIARLEAYRDRGLFPINEHDRSRAVPVFVDNYDTACAVGHLMRESGWTEEVAAIQAEGNLVCLPDVHEGAFLDWVATSGLLREEAALIQPAYSTTPMAEAGFGYTQTASSRGVVYDHFGSSSRTGFLGSPTSYTPNELAIVNRYGGSSITQSHAGSVGGGVYFGPAHTVEFMPRYLEPVFDRWVNISGNMGTSGRTSVAIGYYEFEVAAIDPSQRIRAFTVFSDFVLAADVWYLTTGGAGHAELTVRSADGANNVLGFALLDIPSPFSTVRQVLQFAPQQRIKVEVNTLAIGGYYLSDLGHEIDVVPEPSVASMILFGVAGVGTVWGRRARISR